MAEPGSGITVEFSGSETHIQRYSLVLRNTRLSLEEIDSLIQGNANRDLIIYPNPSSQFIYILILKPVKIHPFEIFNLQGTLVAKGKLDELTRIDIKHLSTGMYFLKAQGKSWPFEIQ